MKWPSQVILQFLSTLPTRQRGRLIISIPMACLFTVLAAFAWLKIRLIEDDVQIQQAQNVQIETKQLLTALLNAEVAMQGFGLTQRAEFLQAYDQAIASIDDTLSDLNPLIQDNAEQVARLSKIRGLVNQSLALMQQKITDQDGVKAIDEQRDGQQKLVVSVAVLYDWLEEGKATFDTTYAQIDQFAQAEERSLEDRKQHQEAYRRLTWMTLWLLAFIGTGGCFLAMHLFHQLEGELAAQQVNLQQANQHLEHMCNHLQRFTADASHELRAPLAAILSNAQVALVEFDEEPSESRGRVEKIVELTKSMSTLVSNLLFLSRQEVTFKNEIFRPVDLIDLLQQLLEEWKFQIDPQSHHVQFQLPDHAVIVEADPNLLKQGIANLLSNAYRYTNPGGTIQVRLWSQVNQAVIEVRDDGIGIPESDLPHIFERFYRVDKSRNRERGGFGLGLAIAHHIVQVHGGNITVESAIGQGSTFRVSLPLA